jgi:5-formyltetrahydrofolate cyclo-ligase
MSDSPKRAERQRLRARRRELSAARDRAADEDALTQQCLALLDRHGITAGDTVTLYEATPVEPPTAALTTALQARGIRVLFPMTDPDLDLDWHDAADLDRTPLGKDAIASADVVLAPGLAVAPDGTRLGQGGGCYDKALPRRKAGTPVIVLLHPGELHPSLPRESHDADVDGVLTAEGFTPTQPARAAESSVRPGARPPR